MRVLPYVVSHKSLEIHRVVTDPATSLEPLTWGQVSQRHRRSLFKHSFAGVCLGYHFTHAFEGLKL